MASSNSRFKVVYIPTAPRIDPDGWHCPGEKRVRLRSE